MPTTFLDSSWPQLGRKIAPVTNEFMDSDKSSFFWTIYTSFWQAYLISISAAPVLLLERERLYESYVHLLGRSTFPGAEPPAGPPKIEML